MGLPSPSLIPCTGIPKRLRSPVRRFFMVDDWMAVICCLMSSVALAVWAASVVACHHREAPARLAGARGLDRGVEREEMGLGGDVLDQAHHITDSLRGGNSAQR
jgi:hypothetical protein